MTSIPEPAKALKPKKKGIPKYPDRYLHRSESKREGWSQTYHDDTNCYDEYPYVFIKEPGHPPVVYFSTRRFGKKDSVFDSSGVQGHEGIFKEHKILNPLSSYTDEQRENLKQQGYREIDPQYIETGILQKIKNKHVKVLAEKKNTYKDEEEKLKELREQRKMFREQMKGLIDKKQELAELRIKEKQLKESEKKLKEIPEEIIVLTTRTRIRNNAKCAERRKDKKFIKDCWKKWQAALCLRLNKEAGR